MRIVPPEREGRELLTLSFYLVGPDKGGSSSSTDMYATVIQHSMYFIYLFFMSSVGFGPFELIMGTHRRTKQVHDGVR